MGASTFGWNSRNQLISTSEGSGSYSYDGIGRRIARTVASTTANYLYDGSSPVRINGDYLLSGLGLDEVYARISSAGVSSYITDSLGSTIGVTNDSGGITTTFAYDPYGVSTETGSDDTPFQFTGRENDGASNLSYFRARYYSPQFGRFISEDPIGLAGGINSYTYANGNPISFADPLGLWTVQVGISFNGAIGPVQVSATYGIAFDGSGNVAGYAEYGGGAGTGADASGGVAVHASNAASIDDLNGPFVNVNAGGGWGAHATGDAFYGYGSNGQRVEGGGITVGFGAGATSSVTVTNTQIGTHTQTSCP